MTFYERDGITIDHCADCREIFLDRGELERLIDAEATYAEAGRPRDDYRGHDKRRKRRGFLGELFD